MDTQHILYAIDEQNVLLFDGENFSKSDAKEAKSYHSAAALNPSLLNTHSFKVPESISPEKLEIQAEMSMYEEAGLDAETDYKIGYVKQPLEFEPSLLIESFAISHKALSEQFGALAKAAAAIDYVVPSFIRYQALYGFEKLEPKTDVFIHLGEEESFAAVYKEGKYLSLRLLPTLKELAEKLGKEVKEVRSVLCKKGVLNDNYIPEEFLLVNDIQNEFSTIVERTAHSISHKRGLFGIDTIDRFFIDFEGSDIPGFLDMFDSYGYDTASKQPLNVFEKLEAPMRYHALGALYALGAVQQKYDALNLTVFERRPHFLSTYSGQFSIVMAASLLLAMAYPIYATFKASALQGEVAVLQQQYDLQQQQTKKLQERLKAERAKRDDLRNQLALEQQQIERIDMMIDALGALTDDYLQRREMLKEVNAALRLFGLSSNRMDLNGSKQVNVHVISEYDRRDEIAKFMEHLLQKSYAHVSTNEIILEGNVYESVIEIRR